MPLRFEMEKPHIFGSELTRKGGLKFTKFYDKDRIFQSPKPRLDGHVKEPYEISMALGARPQVQLLQYACTYMCRHKLKYRCM